ALARHDLLHHRGQSGIVLGAATVGAVRPRQAADMGGENFAAAAGLHGRRFRILASCCIVCHSCSMARPISSCVLASIVVPFSPSRRLSSGSCDALTKTSFKRLTTAGGVPAGAATANQLATRSLPKPSSSIVGTSGRGGHRLSPSIASPRSLLSAR